MRPNDWEWRREQEEACRLFDFEGRRVDAEMALKTYIDTDIVNTYLLKQKMDEIKEDTKKMNLDQLINDKQAADVKRRAIMNKLKVGDKICTSSNLTTPKEIFAFDYAHFRVGLNHRISFEGYEKVSRFWIDPLTITDPDVRSKVSYTNYYRGGFTQRYAPTPKKIIVNEDSKVTVVMWDDGTKTIVKCSEADQYDSYAAYCAAFAKKCYGTNSQLKKTIENLTVVQESKKKKKQNIVIFDEMEV